MKEEEEDSRGRRKLLTGILQVSVQDKCLFPDIQSPLLAR